MPTRKRLNNAVPGTATTAMEKKAHLVEGQTIASLCVKTPLGGKTWVRCLQTENKYDVPLGGLIRSINEGGVTPLKLGKRQYSPTGELQSVRPFYRRTYNTHHATAAADALATTTLVTATVVALSASAAASVETPTLDRLSA